MKENVHREWSSTELTFDVEISYLLNFWVHLEVALGSPSIYYSEEYEKEVYELTNKYKKDFLKYHQGEEFSLKIRKLASECQSIEQFLQALSEYSISFSKIVALAHKDYFNYWLVKKNTLKKFAGFLDRLQPKLKEIAKEIPTITGIPWQSRKITFFPIYCLYEKFQFGAQPIFPSAILLGKTNTSFSILAIAHELIHLNAQKRIEHIMRNAGYEFSDILNEALTNLATNVLIDRKFITSPKSYKSPKVKTKEYMNFCKKVEIVSQKIKFLLIKNIVSGTIIEILERSMELPEIYGEFRKSIGVNSLFLS